MSKGTALSPETSEPEVMASIGPPMYNFATRYCSEDAAAAAFCIACCSMPAPVAKLYMGPRRCYQGM